jgi:Protein of unknown function (DUF3098).
MFFNKKKYAGIVINLFLLILAFIMMSNPNMDTGEFDESIFSFRQLTLAPLVIITAYINIIYLILKKPCLKKQ